MINLPLFSQRSDSWKSKKLGTSLLTLGTSGCLVTCLAMVAKYYGKETDPAKMNDDLVRVNGFAEKSLYIWGSINKIYSDISEPKRVSTPDPVNSSQFAEIDNEIGAGRPVICEVDFIPETASIDKHFIVIIGKDNNGNYVIADPWYGDTATLQRYGDPAKTIQQYVFTFGPMPTQPVSTPTDDQSRALAVITEGYNSLPNGDTKPGNMEAYARSMVDEFKVFPDLLKASKQFDAFIEKWFAEWGLQNDPNKSHQVLVEEEMGKLMSFEDRATTFRSAIEKVVGSFTDDNALLKALSAVKDENNSLSDQVKSLTDQVTNLKQKQKVKFAFNFLGYPIRILEKG